MTESISRENRIAQLQNEYENKYFSALDPFLVNAMNYAQFRYSFPFRLALEQKHLNPEGDYTKVEVPENPFEYAHTYGPDYKLPWLSGRNVLELAAGSKSQIDASSVPYSADPIGSRIAAMNGASVINIDLGIGVEEDANIYNHIQANVCEYLFGEGENISDEVREIFDYPQDIIILNGVIFYKNPSREFLIASSKYFDDLPDFDHQKCDELFVEMQKFVSIYQNNTFDALQKLPKLSSYPTIFEYMTLRRRIIQKTLERASKVLNEDGVLNIESEFNAIKKDGKMVILSSA